MDLHLPDTWAKIVRQTPNGSSSLEHVRGFLQRQPDSILYPEPDCVFRALSMVEPNQTKVVILGQDPYHNPGQAHGLSFSVPEGIKPPPSLKNIFKELKDDLGCDRNQTDLSDWARQGVLLLNASLTVPLNKPGAHMKEWQPFLNVIMHILNAQTQPIVFVLWGAFAQSKAELIANPHHHILKSAHPSPLSAHRGFFGSKPFSKINSLLQEPIQWCEEKSTR